MLSGHAAIGVCTRRCTHPPIFRLLRRDGSNAASSTRTLDVKWTETLEAKSEYYSDEEAVSWQLSDLVEQDIQNAGGIIVEISRYGLSQ